MTSVRDARAWPADWESEAATNADVIERIVEENLGVYRASPSRLQEDVSQEAQVASDYRGRLAYELLQNADHAMADGPGVAFPRTS